MFVVLHPHELHVSVFQGIMNDCGGPSTWQLYMVKLYRIH